MSNPQSPLKIVVQQINRFGLSNCLVTVLITIVILTASFPPEAYAATLRIINYR